MTIFSSRSFVTLCCGLVFMLESSKRTNAFSVHGKMRTTRHFMASDSNSQDSQRSRQQAKNQFQSQTRKQRSSTTKSSRFFLGNNNNNNHKNNLDARSTTARSVSTSFGGEDYAENANQYQDEQTKQDISKQLLLQQQQQNASEVVCDLVGCVDGISTSESSSSTSNWSFGKQLHINNLLDSYWGSRGLLAAVACLYGTNFPLGSIMDHALPASAASSARFLVAALALSPFVFQIHRELIFVSVVAGCFTASGYVTQSLALVDTSPATVSFLGAATVIWCPFLEWLIHKQPMGWKDRPQTWIAGTLCLLGVGVLELCGSGTGGTAESFSIGMGDILALIQAMGFGTGIFMSEQMMKKHPGQALPITSVMIATTALVSMIWALTDGWIGVTPGWESMTLPNLFFDPSMHEVAMAVLWTGLLSTSLNFFLENSALGKVPAGEASVILATEPLWAAAFAAVLLDESFGWNDYAGGFLIVAACLVNTVQPKDLLQFLSSGEEETISTTATSTDEGTVAPLPVE